MAMAWQWHGMTGREPILLFHSLHTQHAQNKTAQSRVSDLTDLRLEFPDYSDR